MSKQRNVERALCLQDNLTSLSAAQVEKSNHAANGKPQQATV